MSEREANVESLASGTKGINGNNEYKTMEAIATHAILR